MGRSVLACPDTHCPGMRDDFVDFLVEVVEEYETDAFVHIGDCVNWQAISYHEKNPSLHSAYDEYMKAKAQVQSLYKAFPKGYWLIGNHDALPVRQARSAGIPEELLRDYRDIWEVPGWKTVPRFGYIEIDGVIYTHGETGKQGQFCAVHQAMQNFKSLVCGHVHSEAGVWWRCNLHNRVFGMNLGFGGDVDLLEFEYGRKFVRKPPVGCGVVIDGVYPVWVPMML